eukprot:CAMPEP_0205960554 /NCGR_PEP_ID=MMETSP1459-20131121/62243_1 /ASSEMBLY_ACC=CAM_ASM_001120 /TAXON_ID=41880 /ORGANISM="Pycnococcus provasolii, Strain RCC931" /LENGTH=56 /DNA_ID=CAMNT_0053333229 /DNA_START=78 /DNA_END=248 /DNA_ORIENTATION=-
MSSLKNIRGKHLRKRDKKRLRTLEVGGADELAATITHCHGKHLHHMCDTLRVVLTG